jgi:hypothetical protein
MAINNIGVIGGRTAFPLKDDFTVPKQPDDIIAHNRKMIAENIARASNASFDANGNVKLKFFGEGGEFPQKPRTPSGAGQIPLVEQPSSGQPSSEQPKGDTAAGIARLLAILGQSFSASDPNSWQNQLSKAMIDITSARQASEMQKALAEGRPLPRGMSMFGVTPAEQEAAYKHQYELEAQKREAERLAIEKEKLALEKRETAVQERGARVQERRTDIEGERLGIEKEKLPHEIEAAKADTEYRRAYAASLPPFYDRFTQEEKLTNLEGWWRLQGDIVRANADLEKARGLEIPNITVEERKVLVQKLYDSIKDRLPKEGLLGLSKPSVDELEKRFREGKIPDNLLSEVRALLAINNSFDIVAKNDPVARQVWMETMLSVPGMYDELLKNPTTAKPYPLSSKSSGVTRSF